MNSQTHFLTLIKNLIENNNFSIVFKLRKEFYWTQTKIYNHISNYNFGLALLEIENALFDALNDEDFKIEENFSEEIVVYDESINEEDFKESIDWSHYDDNLDFDQQDEQFWNQF